MTGAGLRIAFSIHHSLDRDTGAPGVTVDLAEHVREQGHEVEVIAYDDLPDRLPDRAKNLLFPVLVAARVAGLSRRSRLDILDASTGDAAVTLLCPRSLRPRVVVTRSHGLEPLAWRYDAEGPVSLKHRLYIRLLRLPTVVWSLRRSTGIVALNATEERYLRDQLGRPARTVLLSANGIPASLLARPPAPQSERHGIAFVGSYIARKGVSDLAAAVAPMLSTDPDLRLGFFGTGAARDRVLDDYPPEVHDQISVAPRFRREELPALLRGYAVLALPTRFEGSSIALLEAMACGLVPVTTDAPGPDAVIRHGTNGLVVPAGDPEKLRDTLRRVLADGGERQRLAGTARATAAAHTWEAVTTRMLSWYGELHDLSTVETSTLRTLAWRFAPSVMAERATRHQRSVRTRHGTTRLAQEFVQRHGTAVLRGPLKGLDYPAHGDAAAGKLVGSYECELHPWLAEALEQRPRSFVDLGAADGYYAVGVGRASPTTTVHAFELAPSLRRRMRMLAQANGVELSVHGRATARRVARLPLEGALVLADLEGSEIAVLRPPLINKLRSAVVIVELHERSVPNILSVLRSRLDATHTVDVVSIAERDPRRFPELAVLGGEAPRELNEWMRTDGRRFARFVPRAEPTADSLEPA